MLLVYETFPQPHCHPPKKPRRNPLRNGGRPL